MSDVKIKATVVADTAKIKANIEKIRPVIKVNVDTSNISKQVGKALANIQMPKNLISASSTETLTRSSPAIQSRINAAPPLPSMNPANETASQSKGVTIGGILSTGYNAFGTAAGVVRDYSFLKPVANKIKKNLG